MWEDAIAQPGMVPVRCSETKGTAMAEYDSTPAAMFDSGVLYDDFPVPQPRRNKMAQITMNFKGLSDLAIIQQCLNIKTAMTGNATFATPTPTLIAFGTLITTALGGTRRRDGARGRWLRLMAESRPQNQEPTRFQTRFQMAFIHCFTT